MASDGSSHELDLMPSLKNPVIESISATFDYDVAGGPVTLTENFNSYPDNSTPDPGKFDSWGNGSVNISGGAMHLTSFPNVGRGDVTVSLRDPANYSSLAADVTY